MGSIISIVDKQVRHEEAVSAGIGYAIYDVILGHQEHEVIVFNHAILAAEVASAERFARRHHGMLPHTPLLDAAVTVFREDPTLFHKLHQCEWLEHIIGHAQVPLTQPPPQPGTPPSATVAEPTTLGLASLALGIVVAYFWNLRIRS